MPVETLRSSQEELNTPLSQKTARNIAKFMVGVIEPIKDNYLDRDLTKLYFEYAGIIAALSQDHFPILKKLLWVFRYGLSR